MSSPLIGVTTYRSLNKMGYPVFSASEAYTTSLAQSGAIPVLIPLGLPDEHINELLLHLDGILFTGGGDIAPERYQSQPHPRVDGVDPDRDRVEIGLFHNTLKTGLPFLGICRGLQVVNVALGGTLYEDIQDQRPDSLKHQYIPGWPREYLAHTLEVTANSRLEAILGGTSFEVNSLHHQAIRRLADSLVASAHAPDGIIEAFELADYPFGVAVQWHPENLQAHPPMRALFRALVEAAQTEAYKGWSAERVGAPTL